MLRGFIGTPSAHVVTVLCALEPNVSCQSGADLGQRANKNGHVFVAHYSQKSRTIPMAVAVPTLPAADVWDKHYDRQSYIAFVAMLFT